MGHGTRERTWTEIERRIVCGEMAAGARLDEDELADQLAVDAPVVREALCRLERDGFVRPSDAMAAATHDWEFHEELVRHCNNEQLISTLRPLKRLLLRYEYTYMSATDFVSRSVQQHEEIIQALERGDREAASALVEDNFRDSLPGILEQL